MAVTGDTPQKAELVTVSGLQLPFLNDSTGAVGTNTLKKKDHWCNNESRGGKKPGALYIIGNLKNDGTIDEPTIGIAVALGRAGTSDWAIFKATTANKVTPA